MTIPTAHGKTRLCDMRDSLHTIVMKATGKREIERHTLSFTKFKFAFVFLIPFHPSINLVRMKAKIGFPSKKWQYLTFVLLLL